MKPDDLDVVLCLQGGGARAAYQVGVYQGLRKEGLEPDWVIGVSSGALNAAVIAGNPVADRMARLDELWGRLFRSPWDLPALGRQGPRIRRITRTLDGMLTMLGKPNFYWPRLDGPLVNPTATSLYQQRSLRRTMERMVDFSYLARWKENEHPVRLSVACADVERGTLRFFDNQENIDLGTEVGLEAPGTVRVTRRGARTRRPAGPRATRFGVEHLLAASAYPPGAAAVSIDRRWYWDGGVLDNSPLDAVLAEVTRHPGRRLLVFLVDLWSRDARLPRDALAASWRRMEMEHASRISSDVARFVVAFPGGGEVEVIHLTYQSPKANPTDPMDFSSAGIAERRALGLEQTRAVLADWKAGRRTLLRGARPAPLCVHHYHGGKRLGPPRWSLQATSSPSG
jgi:NTE family protein